MHDELTVTLQEEDFVEAYRPARPRRRAKVARLLALIVVLLLVTLLIGFPEEARVALEESRLIVALTGAVLVAAAVLAALLLAAPTLRRRAARSTLADHPGMRDPMHYAFDPENFSVRTTYTQACYPWAQLWDWREGKQVII